MSQINLQQKIKVALTIIISLADGKIFVTKFTGKALASESIFFSTFKCKLPSFLGELKLRGGLWMKSRFFDVMTLQLRCFTIFSASIFDK